MKKIFLVVCIVVTLISPSVARSQGFLLGMATGAGLFGGDGDNHMGGGSSSVLYVAPEDVLKRIKNPLAIMQTVYRGGPSYDYIKRGWTLYQLFQRSIKLLSKANRAEDYEVLQVIRVFDGTNPAEAVIWFCYIEKSQISALSPKQKR
jgi:hypothetical protein